MHPSSHTGLPAQWKNPPIRSAVSANTGSLLPSGDCKNFLPYSMAIAPLQPGTTFPPERQQGAEQSTTDIKKKGCNTSSHATPVSLTPWLLPGLVCAHSGFHFSVSMLLPREIQENQIWQ